jgi:hypothetical protein
MGSIESRISCACRRPALYPGPELPLLRSQHHLCAESSGMDRSCPRSMGHGRALLQRLPDTAPSAGELSVGRLFRITEKTSLSIRAEFTNAFNRTLLPGPTSTNALATQTRVITPIRIARQPAASALSTPPLASDRNGEGRSSCGSDSRRRVACTSGRGFRAARRARFLTISRPCEPSRAPFGGISPKIPSFHQFPRNTAHGLLVGLAGTASSTSRVHGSGWYSKLEGHVLIYL